MGLFDKKFCDICGEKIGFLGNRKLEDGNLCKNCARKLSPWFSDRRQSTVEQIRAQLNDREANRSAVAAFRVTRTLGYSTKVLLDENAQKFMVTAERDLLEANPDVLAFADVTGCRVDIQEHHTELLREDSEGKRVSYNPKRYIYSYDFDVIINVSNPYFDEIKFRLNNFPIEIESVQSGRLITIVQPINPRRNMDYVECEKIGKEIVAVLTEVRETVREAAAEAAKPKTSMVCPYCGATTVPDAAGNCEYCGSPLG